MTDQIPQTRERSLAERIAEDYAEAWRPAAGDSIIGYVQEITVGTTDFGDYPIVTVVQDGGERRSIHAFHTTLQAALADAAPSIGEEIAIKYNGLRVPKQWLDKSGAIRKDCPPEGDKNDPRYHDYRSLVNRAPADVWSKFRTARTSPDSE